MFSRPTSSFTYSGSHQLRPMPEHTTNTWPSDHYSVVTDFEVAPHVLWMRQNSYIEKRIELPPPPHRTLSIVLAVYTLMMSYLLHSRTFRFMKRLPNPWRESTLSSYLWVQLGKWLIISLNAQKHSDIIFEKCTSSIIRAYDGGTIYYF